MIFFQQIIWKSHVLFYISFKTKVTLQYQNDLFKSIIIYFIRKDNSFRSLKKQGYYLSKVMIYLDGRRVGVGDCVVWYVTWIGKGRKEKLSSDGKGGTGSLSAVLFGFVPNVLTLSFSRLSPFLHSIFPNLFETFFIPPPPPLQIASVFFLAPSLQNLLQPFLFVLPSSCSFSLSFSFSFPSPRYPSIFIFPSISSFGFSVS